MNGHIYAANAVLSFFAVVQRTLLARERVGRTSQKQTKAGSWRITTHPVLDAPTMFCCHHRARGARIDTVSEQ